MYSEHVKNRAYTLFLMGHECTEIVALLKTDYPRINKVTVGKWIEAKDDKGEDWRDKRKLVDRAAKKRIEEQAINNSVKIKNQTESLRQALYDNIINEFPKVKSLEGAMYAFKALSEFELKIEGDENKKSDVAAIATAILDVLNEDRDFRKLFNQKWGILSELLSERLNKINRTETDITPVPS